MTVLVATNEIEVLAGSSGSTTSDGDLGARGVELSTTGRVRGVGHLRLVMSYIFFRTVSFVFYPKLPRIWLDGLTNNLSPQEVVSRSNPARNGKRMLPLATNDFVNSPGTARKAVLVELGPDGTITIAGCRSNVNSDGALVGGGNDIVVTTVQKDVHVRNWSHF